MTGHLTSLFDQFVDSFHRDEGVTILIYHSIDESRSKISTAPSQFLRQMRYLKKHHFQLLSLSQLLELLRTSDPLPPKSVVITFDDGYQNNYQNAFPILQEYSFPATVFVTTKFCGETNAWPQPSFVPPLTMLSWKEIMEMSCYNMEIGSHSHSHPNLIELGLKEAMEDVYLSKMITEEHLGKPVRFFAYPYGAVDKELEAFVASEFDAACSAKLGNVNGRSDIHLLERVDVGYAFNLSIYKVLISPYLSTYLVFKQWKSRWAK